MLSGGEQQRVAVARALVTEPSVLLADEPTGDLDERTAEALHALLREMHRERQLSSVIATHNMQLATVVRSRAAAGRGATGSGVGVCNRFAGASAVRPELLELGVRVGTAGVWPYNAYRSLTHYHYPFFAG